MEPTRLPLPPPSTTLSFPLSLINASSPVCCRPHPLSFSPSASLLHSPPRQAPYLALSSTCLLPLSLTHTYTLSYQRIAHSSASSTQHSSQLTIHFLEKYPLFFEPRLKYPSPPNHSPYKLVPQSLRLKVCFLILCLISRYVFPTVSLREQCFEHGS